MRLVAKMRQKSHERFCTMTHFKTKEQDNQEMGYCESPDERYIYI